ncbi:MAG: XRE family transcriptional regulator [Citrobacter freundii]|nr:MAG: XRE family transcriptional regulator [Citrobacter freundii]
MDKEKYTEHLKAFGLRMREIRKQKKMTLIDLEIETGITNGDLSKIENGLKNIEFFTIVKIAEGLGVKMQDLFK